MNPVTRQARIRGSPRQATSCWPHSGLLIPDGRTAQQHRRDRSALATPTLHHQTLARWLRISRLARLEREQLVLHDVLTDLAADLEAVDVVGHDNGRGPAVGHQVGDHIL